MPREASGSVPGRHIGIESDRFPHRSVPRLAHAATGPTETRGVEKALYSRHCLRRPGCERTVAEWPVAPRSRAEPASIGGL